jgi:hypothetical protein
MAKRYTKNSLKMLRPEKLYRAVKRLDTKVKIRMHL